MKTRRTTLPAALGALALLLSAACPAADDPREAALRAAEMERFAATVDADATRLQRLLDDGLEYVHSNGELDDKQSFIESLTSGRRDYAKADARIESVRIFGDVAVIRGSARVTVIVAGAPRELQLGYTDVWLWKADRWQMTAWRSAPQPAATPK